MSWIFMIALYVVDLFFLDKNTLSMWFFLFYHFVSLSGNFLNEMARYEREKYKKKGYFSTG